MKAQGELFAAGSFGNILDCSNYAMQFLIIIEWGMFVMRCQELEPDVHFAVFENEMAVGRTLQLGSQSHKAIAFVDLVVELGDTMYLHSQLIAFSLLLVLFLDA